MQIFAKVFSLGVLNRLNQIEISMIWVAKKLMQTKPNTFSSNLKEGWLISSFKHIYIYI